MKSKEDNKKYTCPFCYNTMDIVLKPEANGRCAYCGYNEALNRHISAQLRFKQKESSWFGKCKRCGNTKEIMVGSIIYCSNCKLRKDGLNV